jgi:hypothetical protein
MLRRVILSLAVLVLALPVSAQSAAPSTPPSCTYATCALRLENGGFSGPRIRTGIDGAARRVGFMGTGIVDAVRDNPVALTEAQLGHRHQRRGRLIGLVTTGAALAWVIAAGQSDRDATRLASVYGGVSLSVIGGVVSGAQLAKADQRFSRAVWLYNRDLPR